MVKAFIAHFWFIRPERGKQKNKNLYNIQHTMAQNNDNPLKKIIYDMSRYIVFNYSEESNWN